MLDLDKWQEVLDTMRKNKLRTLLTGFSVAWGIFILVVLLGSGTGLSHGVEYQFRDDAINSIWAWGGQTSVPHRGLRPGRPVRLTNDDHDAVRDRVDGVEHITSRTYVGGLVSAGREHGQFDVRGVHPGHRYVEKTLIIEGRFLNAPDVAERRKVAVIGDLVRDALLGPGPAVGRWIEIGGVPFLVVGVFRDEGGEGERRKAYVPISTAQRTFGGGERVSQIMVTTGDADLPRSQAMVGQIRGQLAERHEFAPADVRAVFLRNNNEEFQRFAALMGAIRAFIWLVGIGTILAGVVGVSNIMLITVRERTREIGVRKALGATPWSIVGLVLHEAVLITAVAGYVGLVLGVALLELASARLPADGFFIRPEVDLRVAGWATAILVLAGTAAGLVPARRAARIRPIEALRNE